MHSKSGIFCGFGVLSEAFECRFGPIQASRYIIGWNLRYKHCSRYDGSCDRGDYELEDYIEEVRSGYNDEQRARLDAKMRHFDRVSRQLEQRLKRVSEPAERMSQPTNK